MYRVLRERVDLVQEVQQHHVSHRCRSSAGATWNIDFTKHLRQVHLPGKSGLTMRFVQFNSSQTLLAYGGVASEVMIVCVPSWQEAVRIPTVDGQQVFFGEFSPDGKFFVWGGDSGQLVVMEFNS